MARVNDQIENIAIKNQTWVTLHTAETHCIKRILYEEKIILKREISLVFLYQNNFIECRSAIYLSKVCMPVHMEVIKDILISL